MKIDNDCEQLRQVLRETYFLFNNNTDTATHMNF